VRESTRRGGTGEEVRGLTREERGSRVEGMVVVRRREGRRKRAWPFDLFPPPTTGEAAAAAAATGGRGGRREGAGKLAKAPSDRSKASLPPLPANGPVKTSRPPQPAHPPSDTSLVGFASEHANSSSFRFHQQSDKEARAALVSLGRAQPLYVSLPTAGSPFPKSAPDASRASPRLALECAVDGDRPSSSSKGA